MKNLIWKQLRESRILLVIFSLWMMLAACYSIGYELGHEYHAVIGSFSGSAMLYSVVAAIVLAARAAHGEQTQGTLPFTAALPIALRQVATVRIVGESLTLVLPILIAASVVGVSLMTGLVDQAEPRDPESYIGMKLRPTATLPVALEQLASVAAIAAMGGVWLLLVLSTCGCWLRSQAQVGFVGVVLALGSLIASGLLWYGSRRPIAQLIYGVIMPQSLVIQWGYADGTGSYTDHELVHYRWWALGLAIPLLVLLGRLFVLRYATLAASARQPKRFRLTVPTLLPRLPSIFPVRSRWLALIWLELRQSLPLTLCGLLLAVLLTVASELVEHGAGLHFTEMVRSSLPHSMFFVGMLWSVVVASSLYSVDLDSALGCFRRTRPISSTMWFWNKYVIGLLAVLLVLDGAAILAAWDTPRTSLSGGMSYAYIACFPIIHALMYALAVLGTCVFRRPLLGGIVAIVGYAMATTVITSFPGTMQLDPINIYNELFFAERAGTIDFTQHGYRFVYGAMVFSILLMAFASSRLAKPLQSKFLLMTGTQ